MKSLALIFFIILGFFNAGGQGQSSLDSAQLWRKIVSLESQARADFPKSFNEAKSTLALAKASDCDGCKGRANLLFGKFLWANGEYKEGLIFLRKSASIANAINDYDTWSIAMRLMANTYYYQAYYDSAEFYFNKALIKAEEVNDVKGMIMILQNTSLVFHRKGDFERTIQYIFKVEKLKDKFPHIEHHIDLMGAMGSLMVDSIYYNEEIEDELRNVDHYTKIEDSVSLYSTYINIANAYHQLLNYRQSINYYKRTNVIMGKLKLIPYWEMLGKEYSRTNRKDSVFYYYYKAKGNFKRISNISKSDVIQSLGDAHLQFGQFDSALFYYDSAKSMSLKMNNRITVSKIYAQLVRVHTLLGNYQSAEHHLLNGLKLVRNISLTNEMSLINEGKFFYETIGNYKQALYYSEKYKVYLDSVNRQETAINLTRLQVEFKAAKKESELLDVTQLNLLHEEKIKTRNLQVIMSIISVILLGSFGGLYFSKFREKKKTSDLLSKQKGIIENQFKVVEKQNADNEALLHEIHHRVKNNLQIISSLINIKARSASDETKEILVELNNRIHSLGLIHEMLYKSDHLGTIDLKTYLTEQSQLTLSSLGSENESIQLRLNLDQVESNIDSALSIGLISNELITNSIKYAFGQNQIEKVITITLQNLKENLRFVISDNGDNFKDSDLTKAFGLRFVEQLVKSKLNGVLNIKRENGLHIEMTLQLLK